MTENKLFADLGLSTEILKAVEKKGFTQATEIQAKVIPLLLERTNDVIGIAQTGTGKTAAFGLPIIQNIKENNKSPKAIILAPTRELAIQVCDELASYVGNKRIKTLTVYGGASITNQIRELRRGIDIVVGTPGRVLDLIERKELDLKGIEYFILDEADEMLNMGFIEDIETILGKSNSNKSVLLFSATMPNKIKELSKKYMKNQVIVEAKKTQQNTLLINQIFYKTKASEKFDALIRIIETQDFFYGIVFCKTKMDVERVTKELKKAGCSADCIHGDIAQAKREKILGKFKDQKISILVATDVAARGIDVENLSHVINYSLPQELETYIHRIGRTGRAGNKGTAISLVTPAEIRFISPIEKMIQGKISKEELPKLIEVKAKQDEKLFIELDKIVNTKDISAHLTLADSLIEKYGELRTITALLYKLKNTTSHSESSSESSSDSSRDSRNRESRRDREGSRSRDGGFRDKDNRRDRKEYSRDRDSRGDSRDRDKGSRKSIPKTKSDEIRLFIAKGKMDEINERGLIAFLEKETNVNSLRANNIKVCDKFSFATFNAKEANHILDVFEKQNKRRPIVEIASN